MSSAPFPGGKNMKALIATAPRKAELLDYEDREIADSEVKVKVEFASPKHGTEVVDFRGLSPFIDEDYDPEWQIFKKRGEDEARGVVFGEFNLGNMFVGNATTYTPGTNWTIFNGSNNQTIT